MPAIITDSFDYDDIVRVLDFDEAFLISLDKILQPKTWQFALESSGEIMQRTIIITRTGAYPSYRSRQKWPLGSH